MSETTIEKKGKFSVRELAYIGLFAVIITVCSWISVPMAVPFTLQTFAVFLTLLILGGKNGFFAVLTYILMGAVGVPVFAGFKGGIGALFGATGGYILGFILTAVIYYLSQRLSDKLYVKIIALVLGLAVCYAFGSVWFKIIYSGKNGEITYLAALGMCVVPFVLPDLVKLSLAVILSERIKAITHFKDLKKS